MGVLEKLNEVNEKRSIEGFGVELEEWSLSQWGNAVAGEVGELCNLVKKWDRGDFINDLKKQELITEEMAKEAADVVIYLDLLCTRQGIHLGRAIVSRFNEVSDKKGCDIKIKHSSIHHSHDLAQKELTKYGT